jgi:demethylmenaquinone methyltransferase/2-methoxy-6-polyprenyl-1,4-benzoquinol methylase
MIMDLQDVYRTISRRYESTNHILTFGFDMPWRRIAAAAAVRAAGTAGMAGAGPWLDLCSGTGEMAGLLSRRSPGGTAVISADFSVPMLREGIRRRGAGKLIPAASSADALPFPDASFGLVTVTFAARNLRSRGGLFADSLGEIRRVLRPGGIFLNLETSQPGSAPVRIALHAYAGGIVGWLGKMLTGERDGYAYLSGSIRSFPGPAGLASEMEEAGFSHVTWKKLMFGVAAIHTAIA